jgi:phosphatidylglycerophosphate synthase
VATIVALARGVARHGADRLGPADLVTLTRAMIAASLAALTAESFVRSPAVPTLLGLAVTALLLDWVDGWVARRTETVSTLGARFDMEVDALLILVLSVYVARTTGAWVLAIGAARYAFIAARRVLPWMRGTLPQRYWCKVVAAAQGVVLTLAISNVLPRVIIDTALAACLALLAESFGREIWGLWKRRHGELSRQVAISPDERTWPDLTQQVSGPGWG